MAEGSPFGGGVATATPTAAPVAAATAPATAAPATAPAAASPLGFGGGDPFSAPSGISGEKITQFVGELLMVKPTEVIPEMTTKRGVAKDVVRADVAVLSGERAGELIKDMLVFQQALKRELIKVLEARQNPYLLGRLGQSAAKEGKDPAWIFVAYSEADVELARAWLKVNQL